VDQENQNYGSFLMGILRKANTPLVSGFGPYGKQTLQWFLLQNKPKKPKNHSTPKTQNPHSWGGSRKPTLWRFPYGDFKKSKHSIGFWLRALRKANTSMVFASK
jgi:hypothetical protein